MGSYSYINLLSLSLSDTILSDIPNSSDLFGISATFCQYSLKTKELLLGSLIKVDNMKMFELHFYMFIYFYLLLARLSALSKN